MFVSDSQGGDISFYSSPKFLTIPSMKHLQMLFYYLFSNIFYFFNFDYTPKVCISARFIFRWGLASPASPNTAQE